jgi:serine/threonine protein kinase
MPEELKVGDGLGDFEILEVAGAGGMGIVYKARQRSLDRVVALKVIREEIAGESEFRERFLREAKLAASVDHPHVVTVYDVGDEDGRLFLVMQWIDGSDLRRLLDSSGRLTPKRAIAIGTQLAGALDALHGVSGLVHRDVKPANVLLREVAGEDHAYLTDFGIAKPPDAVEGLTLTRTGSTVGTTGYLAPEQIQGKDAGPRSDLYSLGCLVFEMLTGKVPFTGENELAVRWAHAQDPRPLVSQVLPALGHRYDAFFQRALAIDPDDRFESGREFAEGLATAQISTGDTDPTAVMAATHAATKIGPVTPAPARAGAETPPPYGYVTPPPQPYRDRSGSPLALIILGIVAVLGITAAVLAAAGVFNKESSPSTTPVAHTTTTPSQKIKKNPNGGAAKPTPKKLGPPAGSSLCSKGLWVNAVTSCPFAENTRSAYAEADGHHKIEVYSPVTGVTYEMTCSGTSLVTCTGGKGAAVYFDSAKATGQDTTPVQPPEPEPEPTPEPSYSGDATQSCDQNISANEVTSCPFAEEVFVAYWGEYESYGEEPYTYVDVFSPTTEKSYGMECTLGGDIVDCSGGNGAFVTFPMQAVREY